MNRETRKVLLRQVDLYPVTCERLSAGRSNLEVLDAVIHGGARIVQLREKELSSRELYAMAQKFREETARSESCLSSTTTWTSLLPSARTESISARTISLFRRPGASPPSCSSAFPRTPSMKRWKLNEAARTMSTSVPSFPPKPRSTWQDPSDPKRSPRSGEGWNFRFPSWAASTNPTSTRCCKGGHEESPWSPR